MKFRKGVIGEGGLYFVFLLMAIIILGGLYGGLNAYFGDGYDSRLDESNSLFNKVQECFIKEGFFDLTSNTGNYLFFEKCGLSPKSLEDGEHMIYVKNKNGIEFLIGVTDFKIRCFLDERYNDLNLPLCKPYEDLEGNYIITGTSQNSKRVTI